MKTLQSVYPLQNKPFLAILATFSNIFSYRGLPFFEHYPKPNFSDNFEGSLIYTGNVVPTLQNKLFFRHFNHFLTISATSASRNG